MLRRRSLSLALPPPDYHMDVVSFSKGSPRPAISLLMASFTIMS